jgi:hypothetical protein
VVGATEVAGSVHQAQGLAVDAASAVEAGDDGDADRCDGDLERDLDPVDTWSDRDAKVLGEQGTQYGAHDADENRKPDWDALLTGRTNRANALIFRTDDCRATFERIRDSGAEVLQEPIEQPYGVLDCASRDPSGNMVRFSQPLAG